MRANGYNLITEPCDEPGIGSPARKSTRSFTTLGALLLSAGRGNLIPRGRIKRIRIMNQDRPQSYKQLWRVIDGAVADCFAQHPEYLHPNRHERRVRSSIVKRVVGAVHGYAEQSAKSRSGVVRRLTQRVARYARTLVRGVTTDALERASRRSALARINSRASDREDRA